MSRIIAFWATVFVVQGCARAPTHRAAVKLQIDGAAHDYQTTAAQVEIRSDPGRYSVYLLPPAAARETQAHISLRTFSGNPVARLLVVYRRPSASSAARYACFVPGRLSDGRPTLTWTRPDGTKRDRTETGEAGCDARVEREGEALRFTFDAELRPATKRKKKGPRDTASPASKPIRVSGAATVQLVP